MCLEWSFCVFGQNSKTSLEDSIFSCLTSFQDRRTVVLEVNLVHSVPRILSGERVLTATVANRVPCPTRVAADVPLYHLILALEPMLVDSIGRTVHLTGSDGS